MRDPNGCAAPPQAGSDTGERSDADRDGALEPAPSTADTLWTDSTRSTLWTDSAWDALADTSRSELVDGIARRRPPPDELHQRVKTALRAALAGLVPAGFAVTTDMEIRLAEAHRRRADVAVIVDAALDQEPWHLDPEQVLLAVEVVGPGTETTDRKHKPLEYADADIGHYWRVETRPALSIHTYRLGESSQFLETGIFRPGDLLADPTLRWASFEVDALLR